MVFPKVTADEMEVVKDIYMTFGKKNSLRKEQILKKSRYPEEHVFRVLDKIGATTTAAGRYSLVHEIENIEMENAPSNIEDLPIEKAPPTLEPKAILDPVTVGYVNVWHGTPTGMKTASREVLEYLSESLEKMIDNSTSPPTLIFPEDKARPKVLEHTVNWLSTLRLPFPSRFKGRPQIPDMDTGDALDQIDLVLFLRTLKLREPLHDQFEAREGIHRILIKNPFKYEAISIIYDEFMEDDARVVDYAIRALVEYIYKLAGDDRNHEEWRKALKFFRPQKGLRWHIDDHYCTWIKHGKTWPPNYRSPKNKRNGTNNNNVAR
ncbi:hypothetical protein EJ06DRAFT_339356 [Trichodelitschia bisporula]|uniref:Uncharacterized protein n=1 Tax=Trichodelitschia bisporula TaxID=703511 RepID=A0A6G1I2B6_9PEZI|nr:hypothetical protein EJ06DRAFT_339356 [Trichodelitschia bisporula]